MRFMPLAKAIFKEMYRNPLHIGITIALPIGLFLIFHAIPEWLTPTFLVPGIVLLGFATLTDSSGMILARDRERAFLSRLLTAPLRASDFIFSYSLPYILIAIIQIILVFAVGGILGLGISGNLGLVFLVLFVMAVGFIGLGMIIGSVFTYTQAPIVWIVVMLLTVFGGAWMDLQEMGGVIQSSMSVLPFAHALDASRDVMINGAGFSDIAVDFIWVLGYTLLFTMLGVLLFRRRMVE
ncbi:MAG: ABC transporter permease [Dehalococcoidia bacterium]|nr:MAG: ABC transporter permease [Dehalococcoidia bacterium]